MQAHVRTDGRICTFGLWDKSKVVGFKKKANSQGTFVTISVASNKKINRKANMIGNRQVLLFLYNYYLGRYIFTKYLAKLM